MMKNLGWRNSIRFGHVFFVILAMLLVFEGPAVAQGSIAGASKISGVVADPAGATVPGAIVRVISSATGAAITLTTNTSGTYQTPPLQPGTYEILVQATGFQRIEKPNVLLQLGVTQVINFHMKVGSTTQQITVSAHPPLINTAAPTQATIVESKDVKNLPLINRTAGALIGLTPGVYFTYSDPGSYNAPRFSLGATGDMSYYVDGFPVGGVRTAIDQMVIDPPVDSVREVRVESGLSSATEGGAEGGAVYMALKSGTEHYHGSLYYYMRNTALDSTNFWSHTRPPDHWYLGGGSFGGPLWRQKLHNRLFFFVNIEGDKQSNPTGGTFSIPTMAMRQGDFQGLTPIYDPATTKEIAPNIYTRQQFSCNGQLNVICPSRFDPVMQKIIALMPKLPVSVANPTNDYTASWDDTYWRYAWIGKIDAQLDKNDSLAFETMYDRSTSNVTVPAGYQTFDNPFGSQTNPEGTALYGVSETHVFSPTSVNSFNFAYRPFWSEPGMSAAYNPAESWDQKLGISGFVPGMDWNFPVFGFSGYLGVGGGGGKTYIGHGATDIADNMNEILGNSSIDYGIQIETARSETLFDQNPTGSFQFSPAATAEPPLSGKGGITGGDAFASALLGFVGNANLNAAGEKIYREWYWTPYIQDRLQLQPDLSLTLGVRWDVDQSLREITNNQGQGFNPTALNPVCQCAGALTFLGRNGVPANFWNTDWDRFSPHIGLAYVPHRFHNRLVIRGGYGVYSVSPGVGANIPAPNLGFAKAVVGFATPNQDTASSPVFYLSQGFPGYALGGSPASLTPGFGAVPIGQNPHTGVSYLNRNLQFGYVQDLGLSIDYALPGGMVIGIRGQGELGRKLPMFYNYNQLPPAYWAMQGNLQKDLPFPQYSGVTSIEHAEGTTDWYGFTVEATKHYSSGVSLLASWQLSKSVGIMSCASNYMCNLSRTAAVYYQHANGPVGMPYRRLNLSFVYSLPFGQGGYFLRRGWGAHVMSGWVFSSIISVYSGLPFGVGDNTSSLNCFCALGGRLNQVGSTNGPQTLHEWFNTNAFAQPAFGQIGTAGGPVLTGPPQAMWNADLIKSIHLGESKNIKISGEFFNLTNTAQWGLPGTVYGTPQFGVISGPLLAGTNGPGAADSISARLVQLGVHFSF